MLINLSNESMISEFLLQILKLNHNQLNSVIKTYSQEGSEYVNSLITTDIQNTIANSYIKIFHITSLKRNHQEILFKQGVSNLKDILSSNSEIKNFLSDYEISFDFKSETIYFRDYRMNYVDTDSDKWFFVRHRLMNDYNINAFFFIKNKEINYDGIKQSSEFLSTLNEAICGDFSENLNLVENWNIQSQSYIVEADIPVSKLIDGGADNNPLSAKQLINYMLKRLDAPHDIADGQDTAYLSFEEKISPDEIKSITPIEWR
ncbi:hypothetical protein [Enterococcus gallinarum]|uniref:hypothetical protein n=1 Tax=Enterococcus gallinarum TaxID=1353 RepID=UPI002DBA0F87|nr:hypothetical protein [Enterococcus gallinarum]MEB5968973.1 hypothetical protein [Enterococcus gallinarum]